MTKKLKNQQAWEVAKKKYRLSNISVQKAIRLGLNPKKLGSIASHKQQPWKELLADFIDRIYEKSLGQGTFKSDLID